MPDNTVSEHWVTMRDGVRLYTILIAPEPTGKFPLIVQRTPYAAVETDFEALRQEDTHGYAVVRQHCRGRGRSEGVWRDYRDERSDGLDLLDWIRKQPIYNGELFLNGGSYGSSVHFSYLNTDPPDVKAAFLAVQDTERYNIMYRKGFFKNGLHGDWVLRMYNPGENGLRGCYYEALLRHPLSGITKTLFHKTIPEVEEAFLHPDPNDPFWKTPEGGSDYHDACNRCSIPILLVTAFYDIYTEGVFDMWKSLTPERRKQCALLVTPFEHAYNPPPGSRPPELPDFENGRVSEVCPDLIYLWFDHFREGTPLSFVELGKTTYFRLFENRWHRTEQLSNAPKAIRLYLHADRTLRQEKPERAGEITYDYDPLSPASFAGGVCNNFDGLKVQDPPNPRPDIISFLSDPFAEQADCEGRFEVELHCRSTAPDTCFYVRLDLVRDGVALSLRDDIDSLCRVEKEYRPGEERVLRFVFAEHALRILPGDRLRLDVSSSCAPYFQVHTNRRGLLARHTGADTCRNTIITENSCLTVFAL